MPSRSATSGMVSHVPTRASRSSAGSGAGCRCGRHSRCTGCHSARRAGTACGSWADRPAASASHSGTVCPKAVPQGHHTEPPVTAKDALHGHDLRTPPATAPPVAQLPASRSSAASNPAPHGWTHLHGCGPATRSSASPHGSARPSACWPPATRSATRHHILAGTTLSVPRTSAPASKAAPRARPRASTSCAAATPSSASRRATGSRSPRCSRPTTSATRVHPPRPEDRRARRRRQATAARSAAKGTAYRVRAGDTLGAIAAAAPHLGRRHRQGQRHLEPRADLPRPAAQRARQAPARRRTTSVPDTFNGVKYPRAVAEAAARNRAILARRSVPSRSETKAMIVATARRHGVDPGSRWPSPTRSRAGTSGPSPPPTPSASCR